MLGRVAPIDDRTVRWSASVSRLQMVKKNRSDLHLSPWVDQLRRHRQGGIAMKVVVLAVLLVAVHVPVAAEGQATRSLSPQGGVSAAVATSARHPSSTPFSGLFASPLGIATARSAPGPFPISFNPATQPPTTQPRLVCGLTVVPVDPAFDAGIRRLMRDGSARFTIRLVPAGICSQ
jgi:hypothetical protein